MHVMCDADKAIVVTQILSQCIATGGELGTCRTSPAITLDDPYAQDTSPLGLFTH